MKKIVVDASVAIKWFIPEIYSDCAIKLWEKKTTLIAPELLYAEFGNILWKKQRMNEFTSDIAHAILQDFKKLPLQFHAANYLLDSAWDIALSHQCTFYDALYIALAIKEKCHCVTADQKLIHLLKDTPIAKMMVWVQDM